MKIYNFLVKKENNNILNPIQEKEKHKYIIYKIM